MRAGSSMVDEIILDIKSCDLCGGSYNELVMPRIVLISGQVINKYLCDECLIKIKNIID